MSINREQQVLTYILNLRAGRTTEEAPQVNSPEIELLAGMAGGRLYVHDFKAG